MKESQPTNPGDTYGPVEYGVLYPTLKGGEPDRLMAWQRTENNTSQAALEFMEKNMPDEKTLMVSRQWTVINPPAKEELSANERLELMFAQTERTERAKGYTEGYLAAEAEFQRKDEYFKSLEDKEPLVEILRRETPMTTEEACRVWEEIHLALKNHPEGGILLHLDRRLSRELGKGKRCAVCGAFEDPSCVTEC